MTRSIRASCQGLKGLAGRWTRLRCPTLGQMTACLSLLGLAGLSYVFGAAAIYFQLPSSDFLNKAFTGASAWHERGRSQAPPRLASEAEREEGVVDKPGKTWDGFTLYTTNRGSWARLIDMKGTVVHQWELPFRRAWPHVPHVRLPLADEQIHWFRCRLFANGDLLAIYHADADTPCGYGLVKLNKDSQLLWAYPGHVHHDVDVAEDGTIYALAHQLASKPPEGLDFLPTPYVADSLVVLSPEGQERERIPILEAFRDSPYALMLASLAQGSTSGNVPPGPASPPPPPPGTPHPISVKPLSPGVPMVPDPPPPGAPPIVPPPTAGPVHSAKGDLLHVNSVRVLGRALAAKFPLFKPGQVLISLRNLDALAVLDTQTRSVVWAAQGLWRIQHNADFLDNGHLLLFDNSGWSKGSRVVEYDPVTQALPWAYSNEDSLAFRALYRGVSQRLPNGNTFIVDPDNGRLFEVTPAKELVWEVRCPREVTGARRHGPDELTFLKGGVRARP